ncbi:MAG TPA: hypothetical protein VFQ68_07835 [Streptosporangiaceae bacterium]|nr:hypothetical protein [Streptosporangiaceae bacterium]
MECFRGRGRWQRPRGTGGQSRRPRQNLFFALTYNGIGIPVASGILYPFSGIRLSPAIVAAAMALSSLSVVGNANRLRRYRPAPLPATGAVHGEPRVETPASAGVSEAQAEPVTDPVCGMTVDAATVPEHRGTGAGPHAGSGDRSRIGGRRNRRPYIRTGPVPAPPRLSATAGKTHQHGSCVDRRWYGLRGGDLPGHHQVLALAELPGGC